MQYSDSLPQCGEFLRLTIPFLHQHKLPAHPLNYALSYELVSATNSNLTAAFEKLTNSGSPLTNSSCQQLYDAHIRQPDSEQLTGLTTRASDLLGNSHNLLETMSLQSEKFWAVLRQQTSKLDQNPTAEELKQITATLITTSRAMAQAGQPINQALAEHQQQISELRAQLKVSREAAKTDVLTALNNRRAFDQRLQQDIDQAHITDCPLSLLIFNIDHFKKINDTSGHLVGDKFIKAIAQVLTKQIGNQHYAARIDGEEFAVILHNSGLKSAEAFANNIRQSVEKLALRTKAKEQPALTVTLSGGIAVLQRQDNAETLIKRADQGLYIAKSGGRNQIGFSQAAQLVHLSSLDPAKPQKPSNGD